MPRPNKAVRRQKINAGIEFRKGNKADAYKLWEKAAAGRRELQAKRKKNQTGKPSDAEADAGS